MTIMHFRSLTMALIFGFFLFSATGCSTGSVKPAENQYLHHVVIVWLKPEKRDAHLETVIAESKKLAEIPGLHSLSIGKAIPSERKIVDDSFDIGLHMTFKDKEAMQAYLVHHKHVEFVKKYVKPNLDRLLVYDF